ncbi:MULTISPECIES: hypothetical protein [Paenibacillus]|uniref:hypothetical protein n=1 Tax=Paenibacillus TaxID=44249 RepID=UPI00096C10E0|nr:hypothetical protein [Paenibacillus peoriae]OMF71525.1 hypothetical protein BK145_26525 [Paenibacillus peoriae]
MKFWTVQHRNIARILFEKQNYSPDFNIPHPSNKYGSMRNVYPIVLDEYRKRNNIDCSGIVFGFSQLERVELEDSQQFYDFFRKYPNTSIAFQFWDPLYCLLELEISDSIDVTPIGFNDFIKLSIEADKDIGRMNYINQFEATPFDQQLIEIKDHFNNGTVRDNWVVQVHTHSISKDNIVDIHPIFDYQSGRFFEMNGSFMRLKNLDLTGNQ